jgi:hypothetical protein
VRLAATINQLEQLVQVKLILACEPLGYVDSKACAAQALRPPARPPRAATSRILRGFAADPHGHSQALGAADFERRQQHQHKRRRGDNTMSPDERDRKMLLGGQAALGGRPAGGTSRRSRLAAL